MSEEKIKVSELAKEFPAVPNKDMLRALRELGASAKSMAGSLTTEEAARVREHFGCRAFRLTPQCHRAPSP